MIKHVAHIGLTVTNMDQSIAFYRDILGLKFIGEMIMEGPETDALFNRQNTRVRVSYLNGSDELMAPPIELLQFLDQKIIQEKSNLFKTSISEICFACKDIDSTYKRLLAKGVKFLSQPQEFDSSKYGFGKSKAVYFYDPDGIILELIQDL